MKNMRILVLNGSPKPDGSGNTMALVRQFIDSLLGAEHEILRAYDLAVSPCVACGCCSQNGVCALDSRPGDAMPAVRGAIARADCVVVASPLHFTSLTAPLVALISRWQSHWPFSPLAGKRRIASPNPLAGKKRVGLLIATGGREYKDMFDCARRVVLAGFITLDIQMTGVLAVGGLDAGEERQ